MSLKVIKGLARSTSFRLNLWYASIFSLSAGLLFLLIYWMLSGILQEKEREVIVAQLNEYSAVYQAGGASGLQGWIQGSNPEKHKSFYLRLLSPRRAVIFSAVPEDWVGVTPKIVQVDTLQERILWNTIPKDQEKDFTFASICYLDGSILEVGRSTTNRETLLQPFRKIFIAVMGSVLLLGLVGGAVFGHRAMLPVRQIVAAAQSIIATGRLDARVPVPQTRDDLEEMSRLFNHMLNKNQDLIRGMKESLDNVAHDLRTPLTRLRGTAELALQGKTDPDKSRDALAECVEESDRVLVILKTLLDVAEAESGVMNLHRESTRLNTLLDEVVDLYQYVAEEKKIRLETWYSPACEAVVDPNRMRQVFANLLDNAIKYTLEGGQVRIRAERSGTIVAVSFEDTGIGIAGDDLNKIWERLFRGDRSRSQHGLGLGLSLVKAVVEAHQGRIEVWSEPDRGSRFTILLPAAGIGQIGGGSEVESDGSDGSDGSEGSSDGADEEAAKYLPPKTIVKPGGSAAR